MKWSFAIALKRIGIGFVGSLIAAALGWLVAHNYLSPELSKAVEPYLVQAIGLLVTIVIGASLGVDLDAFMAAKAEGERQAAKKEVENFHPLRVLAFLAIGLVMLAAPATSQANGNAPLQPVYSLSDASVTFVRPLSRFENMTIYQPVATVPMNQVNPPALYTDLRYSLAWDGSTISPVVGNKIKTIENIIGRGIHAEIWFPVVGVATDDGFTPNLGAAAVFPWQLADNARLLFGVAGKIQAREKFKGALIVGIEIRG